MPTNVTVFGGSRPQWTGFGLGLSGCIPPLFSVAGHADASAAGAGVSRVAGGWIRPITVLVRVLLPVALGVVVRALSGHRHAAVGGGDCHRAEAAPVRAIAVRLSAHPWAGSPSSWQWTLQRSARPVACRKSIGPRSQPRRRHSRVAVTAGAAASPAEAPQRRA
ncbi:hypothetical protein [Cryptosporangium phraense]|uniref:Uncharacterized protein n=1 Tax=Cryptosporangium phraense TaxID=2593070 RepID=A0A545AEI6_9ACTN|nr:hypothetical protein [Cryptosporangium phraense]TQS39734.1 hypothetical protein FL583_38595 [Cryptosporangium phraense]